MSLRGSGILPAPRGSPWIGGMARKKGFCGRSAPNGKVSQFRPFRFSLEFGPVVHYNPALWRVEIDEVPYGGELALSAIRLTRQAAFLFVASFQTVFDHRLDSGDRFEFLGGRGAERRSTVEILVKRSARSGP